MNNKHIQNLINLLSGSLNAPIYFIDSSLNIILKSEGSLLLHLTDSFADPYFEEGAPLPKLKTLKNDGHFLCLTYYEEELLIGTFLIGPLNYHLTSFTQVIHQGCLLYYLLYRKHIDFNEVLKDNFFKQPLVDSIEEKLKSDFTTLRQIAEDNITFFPLAYETHIINAIEYGDPEQLINAVEKLSRQQPLLNQLLEDPLHSSKVLYMTLIILGARASIRAGLIPDVAHKLTVFYLDKIENTSDMQELAKLQLTSLLDFTMRVQKINTLTFSRPVLDAIFFIHKNLYDNVSLEKVATELHFNKSYLARLFKKEMNETIGEFILREKVEEAKRLLMVSKHSLLDISVLLHFNDQSHFTKVFKQFVGLTPKKYRDQHQFKG